MTTTGSKVKFVHQNKDFQHTSSFSAQDLSLWSLFISLLEASSNLKQSHLCLVLVLAQNSFIAVIGTPAEVYVFGSTIGYAMITSFVTGIVSAEIYIPLFYRLKLTSTYEVRAFLPPHSCFR